MLLSLRLYYTGQLLTEPCGAGAAVPARPPPPAVLRCLLPGRPTPDCLFCDVNRDGSSALKVWNMNRCGGVVAAFNLQVWWGGVGPCVGGL